MDVDISTPDFGGHTQLNASNSFQLIRPHKFGNKFRRRCQSCEPETCPQLAITTHSPMMFRVLCTLIVFRDAVAGGNLDLTDTQYSIESFAERYAASESIVKNFKQYESDLNQTELSINHHDLDSNETYQSINETTLPPRKDEPGNNGSKTSTVEDFFSHNLHGSSTDSQVVLERNREGTLKFGKKNAKESVKGGVNKPRGPRNDKGKAGKDKTKKGDKTMENTSAPSITPNPTITQYPTSTATPTTLPMRSIEPSFLSGKLPLHSLEPIEACPNSSTGNSTMAAGRESSLETVTRPIQTVTLEYTTSGVDKPGMKDYDELAEVTRLFLDESLQSFFSDIVNVTYIGTVLDFYQTKDVSFVEYQFTTKWANASQVPSVAEVSNVTMLFFDGSSLKSYVEKLRSELSSSNIFSSDTNVCLEKCNFAPVNEGSASASAEQSAADGESNDTTTVIAASLAAVGFVTGLAILAIYCRRRRRVQEHEQKQMKPDASQCSTLDTSMMIPLDISVLDQQGSIENETMPEQQHRLLEDVPEETDEQDGHFSEITLNAV